VSSSAASDESVMMVSRGTTSTASNQSAHQICQNQNFAGSEASLGTEYAFGLLREKRHRMTKVPASS
jgi:hypothetical protein